MPQGLGESNDSSNTDFIMLLNAAYLETSENNMGKYRTRKQWFQYHLSESRSAAKEAVERQYLPTLHKIEQQIAELNMWIEAVKVYEPFMSRVYAFFGKTSEYRRANLLSLQDELKDHQKTLWAFKSKMNAELDQASKQGEKSYLSAHAARKAEAIASAERVLERKQERRIKYLEQSPAIRSAARSLKRWLVEKHSDSAGQVQCFYCGKFINAANSHLEHKHPIVRGGKNRRSNITLACASCNLKKGRKTHEEFLKSRAEK